MVDISEDLEHVWPTRPTKSQLVVVSDQKQKTRTKLPRLFLRPGYRAKNAREPGAPCPWLHALPDFANSVAGGIEHPYEGIDAMFAKAYSISHIKELEADSAGKLVHVDLAKTFGFLKQHAYAGYCSLEWDSPGDPYQGTADLIEKTGRFLG